MTSILELLRADIRSRDEAEFSLGDTLDVKASILLVVVIFLAGVTGGLLTSGGARAYSSSTWIQLLCANFLLGGYSSLMWIQLLCAIFFLVSGGSIVYVVWPRTYLMEDENRASTLLEYFAEDPAAETDLPVGEKILREDISKAVDRVRHNHTLNARKSLALQGAFYAAIPALILELVSAAMVLYLPALLKGHIL